MASARDQVRLVIGGQAFAGWTAVDIERGLDALAGTFRLAFTERWPGQPEKWGIEPGDAAEVWIGEDKVLTGWIDRRSTSIDPDSHPLEVTGREKTCDLVDCSAVHSPGSWKSRRLEQIAGDLAEPFGIKVTAVAPTGAVFGRFALQQGETVFEAIERMARQRGVLPVTTPDGDLEFRRPASAPAGYHLAEGENVEAISWSNDISDRFSTYHLKGEAADGTRPKAQASDPAVRRKRPLLIVNDDDSTAATLAERARWEATVRAGKAQSISVTASGWRDGAGALFLPDRLAPVRSPTLGLDASLLIVSVRYELSERGARTRLQLAPPEAYSLLAIPDPATSRRTATTPPGDA